ncbi:MAG: beta-phosphoglucomutase [Alphaproteobacteria bacterium]|nr:beta-phosphoglucomutase [Alphaproteobacteria bacterium]
MTALDLDVEQQGGSYKPEAFLFDLDGVIVDTAKYHFLAWREIARELGFTFTEAHNERLKGVSRMRSLDFLLETGGLTLDDETKKALAARKNDIYLQYVLKMGPEEVLPGAREFLAEARRRGLKVALVSASRNAATILERLKLSGCFDAVVDGNRVSKTKPDPEAFLMAARDLAVPEAVCVVFEDATAGIEGAAAAGMACVGIGDRAILKKADVVAAGLAQISVEDLLGELGRRRRARKPSRRKRKAAGIGHWCDDAWSVVEEGFDPDRHKAAESIFSIGNGYMGQRANFEERYSGETLQGSYLAGIYYPDRTRVGWWKVGYPEYFAKVLNSPNWIGIDVEVNGHSLDLARCTVDGFRRVLDMRHGTLSRSFTAATPDGARVRIEARRFVSMANPRVGAIRYSVTAIDAAAISLSPYIDGDVKNEDANYNEYFWNILEVEAAPGRGFLLAQTRKLDFRVAVAAEYRCSVGGRQAEGEPRCVETGSLTGNVIELRLKAGETAVLDKIVAITSSADYGNSELKAKALDAAAAAVAMGFDCLLAAHKDKWAEIWSHSDIVVEGDIKAQQGIRFAIFHLNQTYTGQDARLNIGPKGFTGEKYGGSTYWDTEAFCIPFYLSTAPSEVTRNLLLYRYKHLPKAIENAAKLGFGGGAALYPMVTMNGEECHNEWEITFEEIHRNGAIAFAIYNYVRHTGDESYLADYGLEVLIGIARFWAKRASHSAAKGRYVILGVTGPNEYENNVNNNWFTNTIACWCMDYARETVELVWARWPERFAAATAKTGLDEREPRRWQEIAGNMYFPYDQESGLFLQQEGYLDKEQTLAKDIDPAERPINQHWSWDRILRSPFIKQADTLQGLYLFETNYDLDLIRRHFAYYEARTVHESSLSPCVHAVLAAKIGEIGKAYELYLRSARLDLDDYNHEVDEGLHITSMAGTWMAMVEGFGGKRMHDGKLFLDPVIPRSWQSYSFRLLLKNQPLEVTVTKSQLSVLYMGPESVTIQVYGKDCSATPGEPLIVPIVSAP